LNATSRQRERFVVVVAKLFLGLTAAMFALLGLAALAAPDRLLDSFDLVASTPKGTAEIRSLYGGAFLAWAAVTALTLAGRLEARALLFAVGLPMALVALFRLVSLATDGVPGFNIPALIGEALIALACWAVYARSGRSAGALA
jgi:hypothetical protein